MSANKSGRRDGRDGDVWTHDRRLLASEFDFLIATGMVQAGVGMEKSTADGADMAVYSREIGSAGCFEGCMQAVFVEVTAADTVNMEVGLDMPVG